MRTDNLHDRVAELERTVEELRRELLRSEQRRAAAPGLQILSVELDEDIGDTTTNAAGCNVLDWDGSADADTGQNKTVYEWPAGASDLVDGDKSRALWSNVRRRWEFLLGGTSGTSGTQLYLGKTDAAISKGSSGTVSIWSGTPGSETDSTSNLTSCQNKFGDVASGKWVMVAVNPFGITGNYLIAAEC